MALGPGGTLSVFDIGGNNFVCRGESVTYTVTPTLVDTSCIDRFGKRMEETKRAGSFSVTELTQLLSGDRVSHLDLTEFALNTIGAIGQLRGFELSAAYEQQRLAGVGQSWVRRTNRNIDLTVNADFDVTDDGLAQNLMVAAHSNTYSARDVAFRTVINGLAIEFPGRLGDLSFNYERNGLYNFSATIAGKAPNTGPFPTLPTTGTSLLARFLYDWRAQLAVTFTPAAVDLFSVSGLVIPAGLTLNVSDDDLMRVTYELATTGIMSAVTN